MFASRRGVLVSVKLLVESGADVDAKSSFGSTALMYAAKNDHAKVVSYLVKDAKADLDARNDEGMTALMYAAMKGHTFPVKILLNAGADISPVEMKGGNTALLLANNGGFPAACEAIEKAGGNLLQDKMEKNKFLAAKSEDDTQAVEGDPSDPLHLNKVY